MVGDEPVRAELAAGRTVLMALGPARTGRIGSFRRDLDRVDRLIHAEIADRREAADLAGCSSAVRAVRGCDAGSEALGMSAEPPAAAADPHIAAVTVEQHREDGVFGAMVMSAQALAVVG